MLEEIINQKNSKISLKKFKTDTLIYNAFLFIANYSKELNGDIGKVYSMGLNIFESVINHNHFPTSYTYLVDLDLFDRWVIGLNTINNTKILSIDNELYFNLSLIEMQLSEIKINSDEYEIAKLNKQEIINHSSYLLFELYLKYLENPEFSVLPDILKIDFKKNLLIKNAIITEKLRFSGMGVGIIN